MVVYDTSIIHMQKSINTGFLLSCHERIRTIIYTYYAGLARWERAREQWLAHKSVSDTDDSSTARAAVPLEVDEIIDVIFSPRWRNAGNEVGPPRRFPQNVPLPQMVDVLVDLWEAEGLDT